MRSTSVDLLTIARLSRLLERNCGDELSLPQYRTLGLLLPGHERTSELAKRLAVPKPTLTALIDSLVVLGFVVREGAAEDRRVVRLSITTAGRAAHGRATAVLAEVFDEVLDRCPDPTGVLDALDDLRQALDTRFAELVAAERQAATPRGDEVPVEAGSATGTRSGGRSRGSRASG